MPVTISVFKIRESDLETKRGHRDKTGNGLKSKAGCQTWESREGGRAWKWLRTEQETMNSQIRGGGNSKAAFPPLSRSTVWAVRLTRVCCTALNTLGVIQHKPGVNRTGNKVSQQHEWSCWCPESCQQQPWCTNNRMWFTFFNKEFLLSLLTCHSQQWAY